MTVPALPGVVAGPLDGGPGVSHGPTNLHSDRLRRLVTAQRELACAPPDADAVFALLARSAREVFEADGAVAAQPVPGGLAARASTGSAGPPVGEVLPREGTLCGLVLDTLEPQICYDGWSDPRSPRSVNERTRTRSSIIAPLVHDGVAIGLVAALASRPAAFTDDDLALLHEMAQVASGTLRTALLRRDHDALHARAESILDVVAEGLVEFDAAGRIVFANSGARRMLGLTIDAVTGQTIPESGWSILDENGAPRPVETVPALVALTTGTRVDADVLGVKDPDGRLFWLLANAVPTLDESGRVSGVVSSFADITAYRALETERRGEDALTRAAQELTGLAWWSLDLQSGRHEWSDAMFRLVGLRPGREAPDAGDFISLIHPDDRADALALAERGFDGDQFTIFRVVHPDRTVRHLQSWTEIQTDVDGRPVRVVGATMDVTDRQLAAAEVESSRTALAAALELSGTATWEWHVREDDLVWSDRMVRLMGAAPSDGRRGVGDFLACLHPDDRDRVAELGSRTVAGAGGEEARYRVVHPDGSVRHIRALTDVRTDAHGEVVALWGTAIDETAQVESASRLAASEEHFRVAFDNAPIGMSMIGLTPETRGRYLRANDAFLTMVGYPRGELVGRTLAELTHTEDVERDQELFDRLVDGRLDSVSFEKHYLRKDGSAITAWLSSSVARGHTGEPLFLISHAVDVTERLAEQAELERLALTDTLTGLANRTLLTDRLDQAIARLQRSGDAVGMLLLDIDRFKLINDSFGHVVGDALLREVAGRISDVSRADATVARLGGDEFVVLAEGLRDPDEVHTIARRLLEALRRPYALDVSSDSVVATVSIGVSLATSPDRTAGDLYREADLALYRAKDGGRDQYALFDETLRARAEARMSAERLLRDALHDQALVAAYQPIVDLVDGRIHSAEALVRIRTADGLVLPEHFIDVAEETGLIVEVDARMFEVATAEYARLRVDPSLGLRRMTTNVSARSLEDPTFVDRLRRALTWYDVPGDALRIELTERSLLTTSPVVRDSLARLASLGLHIGLDDFGTGYSALAYLQRFPLQFLKIDRSFVNELGRSHRDDAVVAAVVDLAHAHSLVVIAEGVERREQLDALRAMGCDRAQGYLMGRPVPAEELEALLRSQPQW